MSYSSYIASYIQTQIHYLTNFIVELFTNANSRVTKLVIMNTLTTVDSSIMVEVAVGQCQDDHQY